MHIVTSSYYFWLQVRPICFRDFDAAFKQVRASVSEKDLELYIDWNKQYGSWGMQSKELAHVERGVALSSALQLICRTSSVCSEQCIYIVRVVTKKMRKFVHMCVHLHYTSVTCNMPYVHMHFCFLFIRKTLQVWYGRGQNIFIMMSHCKNMKQNAPLYTCMYT